jgi:hypothetical protein
MGAFTDWLNTDRDISRNEFGDMRDPRQQRLRTAFRNLAPTTGASTTTTTSGGLSPFQQTLFQDEPRVGWDWMMGNMGLSLTGGDPFAQWMNTTGYDNAFSGFNAARMGNADLQFNDYLTGLGGADYWKGLYEDDFANLNPEAAWHGGLTSKGFNPARGDAMSNYLMSNAYDNARGAFEAQQSSADFAANTGWDDAIAGISRNSLIHDYKDAPLDAKGLSYAPYEGFSRWMAFVLAMFAVGSVLLKVLRGELPEMMESGLLVSLGGILFSRKASNRDVASDHGDLGAPLSGLLIPCDTVKRGH